jgi:3'-5' exoribonuclease
MVYGPKSKGGIVKSIYIAELTAGDDLINEPFLLQEVVRRETKDGRPYLLSTLRDKTGQINSVFWDVPSDIDGWIKAGAVILVTGRVNSYKNALQITVTDFIPVEAADMTHILPSSSRTPEDMVVELRRFVEDLNPPWRDLVGKILLDPPFLQDFANSPAARTMHHAYVGGLLEHTLSMATVAEFLAEHYPYVNKDLLLSGTLLHDMGKALEYDTSSSFDFTDDGRLVGHIIRATIMVEKAAQELGGFPEDDLRQLVHLIGSHHGTLEWGAPIVPKTLEAILLHQIDLLDSRVQGYFDHLRNDAGDGLWTSKPSYMFNTELRRPPDFD